MLLSLQNQIKAVGLQDRLGKQNLQADMNNVFEPVTKTCKCAPEGVKKP